MSAPQQDYAALAQRLRASAELYKFVPDLTDAADALAFLLGEVERLRVALQVICDEAGSHTVALNGPSTGYRRIYSACQAALGRGGE